MHERREEQKRKKKKSCRGERSSEHGYPRGSILLRVSTWISRLLPSAERVGQECDAATALVVRLTRDMLRQPEKAGLAR